MKKTKERLLAEAQRQIYLRGAYSLSVRSITNKLGINPASISYHFKGKEQLIDHIFCQNLEKLITSIEQQGVEVAQWSQPNINYRVINALYNFHNDNPTSLHTISAIADYLKDSKHESRLFLVKEYYQHLLDQCICKDPIVATLGEADFFLDRLAYISDTFEFVSKKPLDELSDYEDNILRGLVSQIISTGLIVWDKLPERVAT